VSFEVQSFLMSYVLFQYRFLPTRSRSTSRDFVTHFPYKGVGIRIPVIDGFIEPSQERVGQSNRKHIESLAHSNLQIKDNSIELHPVCTVSRVR